jgi:hypothetical protein
MTRHAVDVWPIAQQHGRAGLPVAIIGAGPIGLAAAAHLERRGIGFVVYEAGRAAGAAVSRWGHVRLFSPWRHVTDQASVALLERSGWVAPDPERLPYGRDLVAGYLAPLSALPALKSRIRFGTTVLAVSRQGMDRTRTTGRSTAPFLLRLDHDGKVREELASAVIDASGTFFNPNPILASGLEPANLADLRPHLSGALPDVLGAERARFAGRHTLVLGAGHSAANTLIALNALALTAPGTRVTWAIRNREPQRVYSGPDDALEARADLGTRLADLVGTGRIELVDEFEVDSAERVNGRLRVAGRRAEAPFHLHADVVVGATGFRPNIAMLREIRLALDDIVEAPRALAPLIDPNVHSCGTVPPHGVAELAHPEPNFFVAGMKSYGRAPTFLLLTGYEQVRSIADELAGDHTAARRVHLVLPETGVCSTSAADACCDTGTSAAVDHIEPLRLLPLEPVGPSGR